MVSSDDFINLRYSSDLTLAGLAYTTRNITRFDLQDNQSSTTQLRQMVAEIAVELAIHRYLIRERIPHQCLQLKRFSDPYRQTLTIGGRRCEIFNQLLTRKWQIREVRSASHLLLDLPALVHEDQHKISHLNEDDILIFTYLNCLITTNQRTLLKVVDAGQPLYQIHILPSTWSKPQGWSSLGNITLKGEMDDSIKVEIGGLDSERNYLNEVLVLDSGSQSRCTKDFHEVRYLVIEEILHRNLHLTTPTFNITHTIQPSEWRNIWVYGLEIILTGFITCGDYFKRAHALPAGSWKPYFPQQPKISLSMPISELYPLGDLFSRAKSWGI